MSVQISLLKQYLLEEVYLDKIKKRYKLRNIEMDYVKRILEGYDANSKYEILAIGLLNEYCHEEKYDDKKYKKLELCFKDIFSQVITYYIGCSISLEELKKGNALKKFSFKYSFMDNEIVVNEEDITVTNVHCNTVRCSIPDSYYTYTIDASELNNLKFEMSTTGRITVSLILTPDKFDGAKEGFIKNAKDVINSRIKILQSVLTELDKQ